jgi:hypothetical protein
VTIPAISLIITVPRSRQFPTWVLEAAATELADVGGEIVLVTAHPVPEAMARLRSVCPPTENLFAMRSLGVREATGGIVAIGEDHAAPQPGWAAAVLHAHAQHPQAAAIEGLLVNQADATAPSRAYFLANAALSSSAEQVIRPQCPPAASTLSFKRSALGPTAQNPSYLETELIPRLYEQGHVVRDPRVVVVHHQPCTLAWALVNAFRNTRAAYGYAARVTSWQTRRQVIRWTALNLPPGAVREARVVEPSITELALVALIGVSSALGAVTGTLTGPGSSAEHLL